MAPSSVVQGRARHPQHRAYLRVIHSWRHARHDSARTPRGMASGRSESPREAANTLLRTVDARSRLKSMIIWSSVTIPILRAYVDETGDRGMTAKSSRHFAMAGLVIADEDEHLLGDAVQHCRDALKVPSDAALHCQDHVKKYSRRQYATSQLAAVPRLVVNYVVLDKASIPPASLPRSDHTVFYNFVAGIMLERLLLTAKGWEGGKATCCPIRTRSRLRP
jgi:hypothetical protein